MDDLPLELLLLSLTFFVLLLCCTIVGFAMYRLGLHGRILKLMNEQHDPKESKSAKAEAQVPGVIPGEQYNPFQNGYTSRVPTDLHASYYEDEDSEMEDPDNEDDFIDEDNLEEEIDFVGDPVVPNRNKKVVMTGGIPSS